ncbi:MAG TPA: ATP-binding protein [Vicinamibacterales bacterium]|nr:ATP-binding protein [Vicinamibacterales bacterium]
MIRGPARRRRVGHDTGVLLLALLAGAPAVLVALVLLWSGDASPKVRWTLTVVILGSWWSLAALLRQRVVYPLQTLSNLLAGLREGDASVRARAADSPDALGEVMVEANALAETIRLQRLGALEATALLRKVMEEIEVAVFTFDEQARLRLLNRAAERLLGRPPEQLLGRTAQELGLARCLERERPDVVDMAFPGGIGRWDIRRSEFRQGGLPHTLIVLSDVSRTLRNEERQAWQRLMRVLGHEINNSLAPITSIAGSLAALLRREPLPEDWREDARRGLEVISGRAEGLTRFTASYARLARLPQPRLAPLDVEPLIRRVAGLETRAPVQVVAGPPLRIEGDPDQLEQLLINLLRNAVDAALPTGGLVRVGWSAAAGHVEIWVDDEGPGIGLTANLFVPFFTTKPGGSGIGLVLSRQIAEGHGGVLTLANRTDRHGCRALLRLPRTLRPSS